MLVKETPAGGMHVSYCSKHNHIMMHVFAWYSGKYDWLCVIATTKTQIQTPTRFISKITTQDKTKNGGLKPIYIIHSIRVFCSPLHQNFHKVVLSLVHLVHCMEKIHILFMEAWLTFITSKYIRIVQIHQISHRRVTSDRSVGLIYELFMHSMNNPCGPV